MDVVVLQQTVVPWMCLFYSRLLPLNVSVQQQPAFAVSGGVWHTAACGAPGLVCLQELELHLYMSICKSCT
jgi:hypothetical protein